MGEQYILQLTESSPGIGHPTPHKEHQYGVADTQNDPTICNLMPPYHPALWYYVWLVSYTRAKLFSF